MFYISHNHVTITQFLFVDYKRRVDEFVKLSIGSSSRKLYDKHYEKLAEFGNALGVEDPVSLVQPDIIGAWIVDLYDSGLSHSTILSHLSAIKHFCYSSDIEVTFDTKRTKLLLKGIKNAGPPLSSKKRLSHKSLMKLVASSSLHFSDDQVHQAKAMVTLAFYGFLRPSEYCSDTPHSLSKGQVLLKDSHITLKFSTFKHSREPVKIKIACTKDSTCPVKALRRYMKTPLYQLPSNSVFSTTMALWRSQFKGWCKSAELKTLYTPHCLRHGGATWASSNGWPDSRIRAHGRWHSNAFRTYIKGC